MLTQVIVPRTGTRFLFFGGKGGVGKSTLSAATAVWLADQGYPTLLVSTDLQRSLSDLFEQEIGYQMVQIPGVPHLTVMETEPERLVQAHWHRVAGIVQEVIGPSDVLELASRGVSPCMLEMAGFYQLLELYTKGAEQFAAIIFDTAPGGRAIMEITLPFVLARRSGADDPFAAFRSADDARLRELAWQEERTRTVMSLITDPEHTAFLYTLWPESLPIAETGRALAELESHGITVPALIINQLLPRSEVERANTPFFWSRYGMQQAHMETIRTEYREKLLSEVPLMEGDVRGVETLRRMGRVLYATNEG